MIKKRHNFTHLLVLSGFLLLQFGCTAIQPADKGKNSAKTSKNKLNQQSAKSQVKKSDEAAKSQQNAPVIANKPKTKTELTSEILYYLFSAEIAAQRGQIGASAHLYTKAAEVTRDPRVAKQATRIAYYARDDKRAIAAATLWNELEPNNLEARQVLAALLVRVGKTTEAAEHFEYVLNNGKHSERQGFMLITSLLSKEKDKQAALAVMNKLLSTRKDNPNALYAYSQLAF